MPKVVEKKVASELEPEERVPSLARLFQMKQQLKKELADLRRANPGLDEMSDVEKAKALFEWMLPDPSREKKLVAGVLGIQLDESKRRPPLLLHTDRYHPRTLLSGGEASCMAYAVLGCALAREIGLESKVWFVPKLQYEPHACFSIRLDGKEVLLDPINKRYDAKYDARPMDDREAHYSVMAFVLSSQGNFEKAIEYYNKTIDINPEDAGAYYNRGFAKGELGRFEEAIGDYDKAIESNPEDARAYYNRGVAKAELGRNEEAIGDYDKAIELNPEYAGAYYNRGVAKARLGRLEEAIGDYDKAIESNPEYAGAYYNRGVAKAGLGRNEEAIEDLEKAKEIFTQREIRII